MIHVKYSYLRFDPTLILKQTDYNVNISCIYYFLKKTAQMLFGYICHRPTDDAAVRTGRVAPRSFNQRSTSVDDAAVRTGRLAPRPFNQRSTSVDDAAVRTGRLAPWSFNQRSLHGAFN